MRKQEVLLVIAVCLAAGCSDDSAGTEQAEQAADAPAAAASSGRYPWDLEARPYTVVESSQEDSPAESLQHRTVRAVLPAPETRDSAEAAVKEIYEALAADIKSTQADASSRRIHILLYDSLADCQANDGGEIVQVSAEAGATVPAWDQANVRWTWRDPEHRPPAAQLALFHEYWAGIDRCTHLAEDPYHDSSGEFIGKPEDQEEIDWRFAEERWQLINSLQERHGLTEEELARQISYVSLWRQGNIPAEEDVARSARSFQERWAGE